MSIHPDPKPAPRAKKVTLRGPKCARCKHVHGYRGKTGKQDTCWQCACLVFKWPAPIPQKRAKPRRSGRVFDRLIFVGDLLDRGPDPIGVLRLVREMGAFCVMGNHEEKHLRFAGHRQRERETGKKNPMRFDPRRQAEHDQLTDAELAWMEALPLFLRLDVGGERVIVTHAGVASNKPIEQQPRKELVRIRYVDEKTGAYASGPDPTSAPAGAVRWELKWQGAESVIYGHEPFRKPHVTAQGSGGICIGIDTGACFGDSLTALVISPELPLASLSSAMFVSVPARTAYARRLPRDGE